MVVRLNKQGMEQVVMACWTYFTARRSCVYGVDDCLRRRFFSALLLV